MKIVTITVNSDGEVATDLQGFQGNGCEAIAAAFTAGDSDVRTEKKPEAFTSVSQPMEQQA